MDKKIFQGNSELVRWLLHVIFITVSFFILLSILKVNPVPAAVDYLYTSLFLITILPAVYINLYWLLPKLQKRNSLLNYLFLLICVVDIFVFLNIELFNHWSASLFPGYFFISYFTWWEIAIFFFSLIGLSTLLKFSKSRFEVASLQRRLLETEKLGIQSELKALKSQMNPHFFFNTLNSIYSMSLANDQRLPATILQLSDLMRYFLYESKEDTVLLQNEIDILHDYVNLQKIRSGGDLNVDMRIKGAITNQRIAPLLLIIFLENAFKHGAKGDTGPTFIKFNLEVGVHQVQCRIENNIGMIDPVEKEKQPGLGLENVKRRLALIYPRRHELLVTEKENIYIVQLMIRI